MIEQLYFINLRKGRWTFNTNTCPLKSFEIDGQTRITDRSRMQDAGDWQSFNYLGPQIIHLAGDLLADTTEAYITSRLDMMRILCPPPGRQKYRRWGELYLKYYGQEIMKNAVTLDGYPDIPVDGTNPTVSPYTVNFKVFDPYWIGVGTGTTYLI